MKITILGSGSAYGVPMIFNTWNNADKYDTLNPRTRASIFLEDNGHSILIDAGPDFRNQINANNITNIDAVFITHGHYDHISSIPELPRASKILGHPIEIYATKETMEELKRCYSYLFKSHADAEPNSQNLIWKLLPNHGIFNFRELEISTILFPHHKIHSSAFRYKNFAYVTDWQALPDNCEEFLSGLDLLIIECNNGTENEINGHSNIDDINRLISKYEPKRVILTHISTRIESRKLAEFMQPNCSLSYDGMVIEL